QKDYWRASVYWGGSPGWDDSGILPNPGAVVISEVLAHSDGANPDWIELYNTTDVPIPIGSWYLSNRDSNLKKYRIAPGTSIPRNGYKVFYENTDFNNPGNTGCLVRFALSENGDNVYLTSAEPNGVLTGCREVEEFGASLTDVSFGRYYKHSTNNYNFVAMSAKTPNNPNAYPKVGPIVINEIMYNPVWPDGGLSSNDEYEYVELRNISGSPVTLYDSVTHVPWRFTDGIEWTFSASPTVTIPAGGYIVVVRNKTAFGNRYPSVPSDKIYGPYSGHLDNGGESVELSLPGDIDGSGVRHYIRVDRISYSDGSHPQDCPGGWQ
ncbi:MAG: lamin tail domain-containing protein, partial [Planctomycetota bacterium]|nr:lamin tail domain-containing protein [Planctomycetota bacterium]